MVIKLTIFQIRQVFFGNLEAKSLELFDRIDMVHILKLEDIEILVLAMTGNSHRLDKLILLIKESQLRSFFKALFRKVRHRQDPHLSLQALGIDNFPNVKVIHDFSTVIYSLYFITFKRFSQMDFLAKKPSKSCSC